RELTLAILGVDNAGKSTTTKGLLGEALETTPTIGFNNEEISFGKFDLKLYDLGGGKKIRDIWIQYFTEVYGIIYVVDSTANERMEEIKQNLQNLLEHDKVAGKPILLLANKQDKENAMDEVDICEQLNLENLVNKNKCPCRIETCSAIKGTGKKMDKNIKSGLNWLCGMIDHNWTLYHSRVEEDTAEQEKIRKKEMEERRERVRKIREERERKEKEEQERLGIKPEEEDDDDNDVMEGGPFKRVDVNELTKKEQKLKEQKRKQKEMERKLKKMSEEDDKNENESDGIKDLRAPRSKRSIGRLGLLNDNTNNDSLIPKSDDDDDDEDEDSDFRLTPRNRKATPRLPPLQKPLGTRFNEEAPVQKLKKKKKRKPKLKALSENVEELNEGYDDTLDINCLMNVTPRSKKKKGKRKKKKEDSLVNGYGHDFSAIRSPHDTLENDSDYRNSPRRLQENDSDDHQTEVRKLKKKKPKNFLKNNKTAPSDDEFEMNEREVSFSPMGSPAKKQGYTPRQESLSDMFSVSSTKWGLAEDLPEVDTDYKPRLQRRSNVDEDENVIF
ncbi:hypothetical protein FSP39_008790, partial [Pinctada imbricata]